jgi:hypothetical protein
MADCRLVFKINVHLFLKKKNTFALSLSQRFLIILTKKGKTGAVTVPMILSGEKGRLFVDWLLKSCAPVFEEKERRKIFAAVI